MVLRLREFLASDHQQARQYRGAKRYQRLLGRHHVGSLSRQRRPSDTSPRDLTDPCGSRSLHSVVAEFLDGCIKILRHDVGRRVFRDKQFGIGRYRHLRTPLQNRPPESRHR